MKMATKPQRAVFIHEQPPRVDQALFTTNENLPALNALTVASGVFEIEKTSRFGIVGRAEFPMFGARALDLNVKSLAGLIHDLLVFVLADDIDIVFRRKKRPTVRHVTPLIFDPVPSVCLFSGGVDSYAGLLTASEVLGRVEGVFCAHSDQSRMIHIVRRIQTDVLDPAGIEMRSLKVPSIGAHGYAQLRGFLYMVSAAAWMHALKADRLIVTECGPTMYQPRFSPLDSITMTTHPRVVSFSKSAIEILLGRKIEIVLPFEDLTKAEVMAICPEKEGLKLTHSCVSQRFGRHDGTCYGCVIRQLAGIAAGIDDVSYQRNPIEDEDARAGNLLSLLAYSYDVLVNYDGMESYETEMVEAFGKRSLFQRFALDNFAAIHRLVLKGHPVRASIQELYTNLIAKIGASALESRLNELARGAFEPSF